MASVPIISWQIDVETVTHFIFLGSKITADGDCSHEIKSHLLLGRKVMTNLDSILKNRDSTLPTKVHIVKAMVFLVVMYICESWTIKKAEHQKIKIVVLEKTLESPWTERRSNQSILKKIKPINPKGEQSWIFIRRTDAEAEAPIIWPHDVKNRLISKDPDAGKDWGQKEKEVTEDEIVGWHHQLNGRELEQTLEDSERQGSLVCCCPWDRKESDMTATEQQLVQFPMRSIRIPSMGLPWWSSS